TPQPLVSSWSPMVENLLTSPWAFWMSASKPAAVRPSWRYLRSKSSQRLEEAESGRMTQARLPAASPPVSPPVFVPPPEPAQPASSMAADADRAAAATSEDFFISCLFHRRRAGATA